MGKGGGKGGNLGVEGAIGITRAFSFFGVELQICSAPSFFFGWIHTWMDGWTRQMMLRPIRNTVLLWFGLLFYDTFLDVLVGFGFCVLVYEQRDNEIMIAKDNEFLFLEAEYEYQDGIL